MEDGLVLTPETIGNNCGPPRTRPLRTLAETRGSALTAQALGDYATGSNHVLPTSGAARSRGGLSAADFVRITSVQRVDRDGLARIGRAASTLARAEGLLAHARSIDMRLGATER